MRGSVQQGTVAELSNNGKKPCKSLIYLLNGTPSISILEVGAAKEAAYFAAMEPCSTEVDKSE